jgi:CheY-like chemotaxis protein
MARKKILFIDDEYLMREMMYELLTDLGYDVRTEENGRKGVAVFRESPGEFDLVLTDLMMFEMPGDRVSEEIRAIRPDIPVMVMTARPDRITPERAMEAGVCKVLSKAMTKTELREALRGVL